MSSAVAIRSLETPEGGHATRGKGDVESRLGWGGERGERCLRGSRGAMIAALIRYGWCGMKRRKIHVQCRWPYGWLKSTQDSSETRPAWETVDARLVRALGSSGSRRTSTVLLVSGTIYYHGTMLKTHCSGLLVDSSLWAIWHNHKCTSDLTPCMTY